MARKRKKAKKKVDRHEHARMMTLAVVVAVIGLWFTLRDLGYLVGPTSQHVMWPLLVLVAGVALWAHYADRW